MARARPTNAAQRWKPNGGVSHEKETSSQCQARWLESWYASSKKFQANSSTQNRVSTSPSSVRVRRDRTNTARARWPAHATMPSQAWTVSGIDPLAPSTHTKTASGLGTSDQHVPPTIHNLSVEIVH